MSQLIKDIKAARLRISTVRDYLESVNEWSGDTAAIKKSDISMLFTRCEIAVERLTQIIRTLEEPSSQTNYMEESEYVHKLIHG